MANLKFVSWGRIKPVPAGMYAVISGSIPDAENMYDEHGQIKRSLWQHRKIFKSERAAKKYRNKLVKQGWQAWREANGLNCPN
ncbi:hypothetical protein [Fibrella aestuarina]|uniref:hypothetical protein n=1 Tax=Fibrella aestuarina TaxID=651143 RepID=UPI0002D25BC5|nr:hypothetical protein [Fibrella aestuarina]